MDEWRIAAYDQGRKVLLRRKDDGSFEARAILPYSVQGFGRAQVARVAMRDAIGLIRRLLDRLEAECFYGEYDEMLPESLDKRRKT